MNSINTRKLEVSDLPKLCDLLETRDGLNRKGAEARTKLMEWVAFHNPIRDNNEATYYVVEDDSRIVAFHGRMPTKFSNHGEVIKGYYVHDLYVDPDYRKKGMGFWITIELAKVIEDQTDSFFCLFGMTPLNLQMQRRRGYYETSAPGFAKILNPRMQLEKYIKAGLLIKLISPIIKFMLGFLDQIILLAIRSKGEIFLVERFDDRFDELNRSCMRKLKISSYRDMDHLNWKYIDRPYKREIIYGLKSHGEIKGYIILGLTPYEKKYKTGRIVDILADPDDSNTMKALFKCAILHFKKLEVHQITCVLSDLRFIKTIKKFLFLQKPGKTLMIGNLNKTLVQCDRFKDVSNWHITYGESDAYMLND